MSEVKEIESAEEISVFEEISRLGHEQVMFCHDEPTGLKAIIGIHNTVLGPSLGGTRIWNYASEEEALRDVLRLSRGMTFKNAISGLNLGGGKAVIIGDAAKIKSEALLRRFGRFVDDLGGKYITAEDVNMKTSDIEYVAMSTEHVTGLPEVMGGGGDPSPVTAYGTYMGMKAAAKKVYGSDNLENKKITVQGVGQVGTYLVERLRKEGAEVFISDISDSKLQKVAEEFGAKVVSQEDIYDMDVDIYAPCALGATLNDDTISRLKCKVVAGAANNQLADEQIHGRMLIERGITYAPDFLINAGGVMNCYAEYQGGYKREKVYQKAETIYNITLDILNKAEKEDITTQEAALKLALKRITDMGNVKLAY
ncbi:Glu/Leu/Phe/Val dehydrogenase dimerization domain-containing protein [Fulvivirgaceae bacterium BMA10]|uniref:Glu/Leu/Phe/Val dehydrogenase dimerization domain-containing protein n=1 Tax=Splendidivirga corallicola TaxID=3051826 RepID=A0ABT8KME3_9BACT|nr:Glu/Leu/Phe/Val dehydrogenase dimerization domain-containing protein [Fulvivirgaceae bacterium BMA10]